MNLYQKAGMMRPEDCEALIKEESQEETFMAKLINQNNSLESNEFWDDFEDEIKGMEKSKSHQLLSVNQERGIINEGNYS